MLINCVAIESVSKMLSYKNLRTTQHYAKFLVRKVIDDMKILKDKFENFIAQKQMIRRKSFKKRGILLIFKRIAINMIDNPFSYDHLFPINYSTT